eukprot:4598042-Pyramimonas_sp.AAC.1
MASASLSDIAWLSVLARQTEDPRPWAPPPPMFPPVTVGPASTPAIRTAWLTYRARAERTCIHMYVHACVLPSDHWRSSHASAH